MTKTQTRTLLHTLYKHGKHFTYSRKKSNVRSLHNVKPTNITASPAWFEHRGLPASITHITRLLSTQRTSKNSTREQTNASSEINKNASKGGYTSHTLGVPRHLPEHDPTQPD